MGLLNIFRKSTPQSNTRKSNSSSITYTDSFNTYVHKYDVSPEDSTIFAEYENGHVVSQIRFHIVENELKICDFLAGGKDTSYHHGTELFLALLKHVGRPIVKISGELSAVDALNRNWNRSITFYADLPKYIFSNLGLNYKFHLFDDVCHKNEVTEILTNGDRDTNIERYRMNHLYDEDGNSKNRSGSFYYILQ